MIILNILKLEYKMEHEIDIYQVDFIIYPKININNIKGIIIEVNGPPHYLFEGVD